jgi:hypothetical protein
MNKPYGHSPLFFDMVIIQEKTMTVMKKPNAFFYDSSVFSVCYLLID